MTPLRESSRKGAVATWRKRATVEDMKTGPAELRSTVMTEAQEAMVVVFRRHSLLPLGVIGACEHAPYGALPSVRASKHPTGRGVAAGLVGALPP